MTKTASVKLRGVREGVKICLEIGSLTEPSASDILYFIIQQRFNYATSQLPNSILFFLTTDRLFPRFLQQNRATQIYLTLFSCEHIIVDII